MAIVFLLVAIAAGYLFASSRRGRSSESFVTDWLIGTIGVGIVLVAMSAMGAPDVSPLDNCNYHC